MIKCFQKGSSICAQSSGLRAIFTAASHAQRAADFLHGSRASAAKEDFGVLAGLRVDDRRRRVMNSLLKLLHPGLNGLVFEVLEELFLAEAATAAAEFKHLFRAAMENSPASIGGKMP